MCTYVSKSSNRHSSTSHEQCLPHFSCETTLEKVTTNQGIVRLNGLRSLWDLTCLLHGHWWPCSLLWTSVLLWLPHQHLPCRLFSCLSSQSLMVSLSASLQRFCFYPLLSLCTLMGSLIPFCDFCYYRYAHISIFNSDFFSEFQTHLSNGLLSLLCRYLQGTSNSIYPKQNVSFSFLVISVLCISSDGVSIHPAA